MGSALVVSGPCRGFELLDGVTDVENELQEIRFALHLFGGPVGRRHFHLSEDRTR